MDEMSIVVQFAKLWGMEVANSKSDTERYLRLESYDSEELLDLLCSWKDDYIYDDADEDACAFFYKKIKTI